MAKKNNNNIYINTYIYLHSKQNEKNTLYNVQTEKNINDFISEKILFKINIQ